MSIITFKTLVYLVYNTGFLFEKQLRFIADASFLFRLEIVDDIESKILHFRKKQAF